MEKNSTAYQVHIDGLRALAVLAVLFYHLNEHLVPGGYTGVDVFFVISGYLIVLGIISRLDSGQFSFLDFFHRRVKRIIPAYIGMICVSLAAGMILFPWEKLMLLGEAACFSALYCVNVYYVKFTGGYFDSASESSPLLNLWSLSVEQQFYIVIPFLLVGLYMLKGRRFFALFFCILSLSSIVFTQEALKIQLSNSHIGDLFFTSKSAFYMLHCRIWELLAGALIAVCPEIACWLKRKNWLAVIGIILIIIPYILYTKQTQFPGIAALPCVIGSVLVITSGSSGLPGRLLTFSPIVYIGKISYSLYLYHWPVFLYYKYCLVNTPSTVDYCLMTLISFVLGCFSYHFVENPIRRASRLTARYSLSGALVTCMSISIIGFGIAMTYGLKNYINIQANSATPDRFWRSHPTHDSALAADFPKRIGVQPLWLNKPLINHFEHLIPRDASQLYHMGSESVKPSFVLIGDSHAMHLTPGLDYWAKQHNVSGVYVRNIVVPLWNITSNGEPCFYWDEQGANELLQWLNNHKQIKTVIFSCWWERRLCKTIKDWHGELYPDPDLSITCARLRTTFEKIEQMGIQIIVTEPLPYVPDNVDVCANVRKEAVLGREFKLPILTFDQYKEQCKVRQQVLEKASSNLAHLISISSPLFENSQLRFQDEKGRWMFFDGNHLTPNAAIKAVMSADEELNHIMLEH